MTIDRVQVEIISQEDFEDCDLEYPISAINHIDMFSFAQAYEQAAVSAAEPCSSIYSYLAAICGIHLNPSEKGSVWISGMSYGERRSIVPSDIQTDQANALETQIPRLESLPLKARIADVIWSNNLKKGAIGRAAIDAYCNCIDGLIAKTLVPAYDTGPLFLIEAQKIAQRALQIASATSKRGTLPPRLMEAVKNIYNESLSEEMHVPFSKIAILAVDYKIIDESIVVHDLEEISNKNENAYADAIRIVLDHATSLHIRLGNTDAQQRCELKAIRQLLRMRDECSQAGAKASWVMDALLRLRSLTTDEARTLEAELEIELRSLQKASLREMAPIYIDLNVPEEQERILSHFENIDLPTALRDFAFLSKSPNVIKLKARALDERSGLVSTFSAKHIDSEGRIAIQTPALDDKEPSDEWYNSEINKAEGIRRALVVRNSIEQVRIYLSTKITLVDHHFYAITWNSPFIVKTQASIYALGFAKFFQGDFISAAHLLIPQLESSLRHVLKTHGEDPSKRRDNASEEDKSLDAILTSYHGELCQILGPDLLDEINRLFNMQPGPNLRHELAHGQISANDCFTENVIYACWLLYRLVCLPIVPNWEKLIVPGFLSGNL